MLLCLVKAFFHWKFGEFGFLLRGGQDRDEPLLSEGTLLSGHGVQQSAGRARGGRRIDRRPAPVAAADSRARPPRELGSAAGAQVVVDLAGGRTASGSG